MTSSQSPGLTSRGCFQTPNSLYIYSSPLPGDQSQFATARESYLCKKREREEEGGGEREAVYPLLEELSKCAYNIRKEEASYVETM